MLRIRHQLSPDGGAWEGRIHDLAVERLMLAPGAPVAVLDIGCGDASLLVSSSPGPRRWPPPASTSGAYTKAACEARLADLGHRAVFRRMDAGHLDFPDDCFDAVVSVMCFHEVRAGAVATTRGPLAAVGEALRVLRPGGAFVLVDRFRDPADFGPARDLSAALGPVDDLRREPLVGTLGVPWPLRTSRSLGPVDVISGMKAAET